MYPKKIVKKIPGNLPPPSKKENQGYIGDISTKQKFELEELLTRQNKLLENKNFIMKLPDKGEKIKNFRDKILKELAHRNEVEAAANLLSRLNIAAEGKAAMNKLEWTGRYSEKDETAKIVELDSDDEEDPLKILAQPTGTGVHKKKVIHITENKSLIKPEDLAEIDSFNNEELLETEHVKYIVNKVESSEDTKLKREPFKPYKTTKSNVHDPEKEKQRKQNKHWEVTAATPPNIIHGAVKTLSLNESLTLQKEQADKLQEVQAKHATERLAERLGLHNIESVLKITGQYRSQKDEDSGSASASDNEEENEVHDEEDNDKAGTVVYVVDSIQSV